MSKNQKTKDQATSLLPEGWQAAQAVDLQTLVIPEAIKKIILKYLGHALSYKLYMSTFEKTLPKTDKNEERMEIDELRSIIGKIEKV